MKNVAAYLILVLGGNANPSAADVTKVIQSAGGTVEQAALDALIKSMTGKSAHEVISTGMEKLQKMPAGGGAAPAAAAAGGAAAGAAAGAPAKKEEVEEEESEGEMGFGLFD
eukprot:Selendium_serpulae@DN5984_c0_g1_i1.p1